MLVLLGLGCGLVLLFLGGNWLVKGASNLAHSLGISPLIVGLTVVAFGTSTPELLVSVSAALSGSSDIAISNVVGSNIANIGLILGLSGLIYPIRVHVNLLRREIPLMLAVAILALVMFQDTLVSRIDGIVLLICFVLFILFMIISSRYEQKIESDDVDQTNGVKHQPIDRRKEIIRLIVGIAVLMAGAQMTVSNATELARSLGISELVIGVTLVAVGTSLPELVTSVMAAIRHESDIAIGNVVGSNIFNILGILGVTALTQPIPVTIQTINFDALVMIVFSALVLPFALDFKLSRLEATVFLVGYIGFVSYTVIVGV